MVEVKSKAFSEMITKKINKVLKNYGIYQTQEGVCFLPLGNYVEIYENETDFINNAWQSQSDGE